MIRSTNGLAPCLALLLAACGANDGLDAGRDGSAGAADAALDAGAADAALDAGAADAALDAGAADAALDAALDGGDVDAASDATVDAGPADGGACPTCTVVASLPPGSRPTGLFVDDANVYWTEEGTGRVMQARSDGSGVAIVLGSGEDAPIAVHVRAGFAYWVSHSVTGVVRRTPVGGGAIVDVVSAPNARDLVVGDAFVWWTNEPDDVRRAPLDPSDGGVPDLLSGHPLASAIAMDATHVYFASRVDGYVTRAALDLSSESPLAVGDVPYDVAVDATRIYWTEQGSSPDSGRVSSALASDGSDLILLASGQSGPRGIAIDEANVYWASYDDGTIRAVPLGGGTVRTVAEGQAGPVNVAVDEAFVYWTSSLGDAIVRAPKP